MKTQKKFLIVYLVIIIIIFPSCVETIHESGSTQPNISLSKAIDSMKKAIKDSIKPPLIGIYPQFTLPGEAVTDVNISETGITLINSDNTKRHYDIANILNPKVEVYNDAVYHNVIFVKLYEAPGNAIVFSNSDSAKMFADALYYLKHIDINEERKREREDCLRQVRQTPIDLILAGTTSNELNLPCFNQGAMESLETALNEMLIEWVNRGLQGELQKSNPSGLSDLKIKLEKAILLLDSKAGKLKDAADADARQVNPSGETKRAIADDLATARLLEQRKMMLMDILGGVKQAAAQRAAGG